MGEEQLCPPKNAQRNCYENWNHWHWWYQPGISKLSGDDAAAKSEVNDILGKVGFATIDLGGLASGGRLQQFPGGSLPTLNLIKLD